MIYRRYLNRTHTLQREEEVGGVIVIFVYFLEREYTEGVGYLFKDEFSQTNKRKWWEGGGVHPHQEVGVGGG